MREQARRLMLLGRFALTSGGLPVKVPAGGQRLLAFLAVSDGPQRREHMAWTLWSGDSDARALASLRTALWRLPRPAGRALFTDTDNELALADDLDVDWRRCAVRARQIVAGRRHADPEVVEMLRSDLLPSWYEEWLGPEQERFRQLAAARPRGVVAPAAGGRSDLRRAVRRASPPCLANRSARAPTAA